jgi:hypothetical protein
MISAIGELAGAAHRQAPRQCLSRLQEKLLETADPVDLLIARLAERLGLGSGDGAKWEYGPDEIALFA